MFQGGNDMDKLVIVMTSDKNYVAPTKVAIYSMVMSTPDTFFDIHILCNKNLDANSRENFLKLEKQLGRIKMFYDEIDDSEILAARRLGNISLASYYRLYIGSILKESRCLFIDGDVVVNTDLREVYHTDLTGYYIAGVRDCVVQARMYDSWEWMPKIDLPDYHEYINAGFILFNLEKIREDELEEKFIQAIGDGYRYMDQDILNKYCYGKILNLPIRYNLFSDYYEHIDKMVGTDYSEKELEDIEKGLLIHYPGVFKPWYCRRLKANQLWWDIAENILSNDELEKYRKSAEEFELLSDWSTVWNNIKEEKEIVIFGYSEGGRKLEDLLESSNRDFDILFADNDKKKQGCTYHDKKVFSAKDAIEKYKNAYWIISSQLAYIPIKKQLLELGISEEKICRFIYKNDIYYTNLDEESLKYEMEILRIN